VAAGTDADGNRNDPNAVYGTVPDEPAVEAKDFGSPTASDAESASGAQARSRSARLCNCSLEALEAERRFLAKRYGSNESVYLVKQTEPDQLLVLNRLFGRTRLALLGFLARYRENSWMQHQQNYVQKAALAAAHMRMAVWRSEGHWASFRLSSFNGDDLLNCGWSRQGQGGGRYFFKCRQPEYCPSCNYHLRVIPARREFLPAFDSAPLWYGLTVMPTSNPAKAGVKMFAGYDHAGDEVYEPIVRLSEFVDWPRLHKFDSQCWESYQVAWSLWELMLWLIAGHYFDGLHVAGENDFTYYPDCRSPVGVSHTLNPHFHAYGNTRIPFDRRRAVNVLQAAVRIMLRECNGQLLAYPDIALRPILSDQDMKKAMGYVFKPWNFAKMYIGGLKKGCPLEGLNFEFQSTFFGSEQILHPFPDPSGLSKWGATLGNMSERAGKHYLGDPLPRILNSRQVKRFLEKLERGDYWAWEAIRYEKHLKRKAKLDKKRSHEQVQEMKSHLVDD
jgi:hypothetical protein